MSDVKRTIVKKFIKLIQLLIPKLGCKKTHIVFEACEKFHYMHIESVVKSFVEDDKFKVTIIKWANFDPADKIPNIIYKTFNEFWHDWFTIYDILVTTELERRPGWFDGIAIGMSHGAGPKMSYMKNPAINDYDVIFSVGPMTYEVQKAYVNESILVEKVGLPITDNLLKEKNNLPSTIRLSSSKSTILYAPSWSNKKDLISMDDAILHELSNLQDYNIIIRPHPNLLNPAKCNGIDWNVKMDELKKLGLQISYSQDHSVYEILQHVDILIGDMSSVTYEFLILDRPIILYMKEGVLSEYDADDFFEPLIQATTSLKSANLLSGILKTLYNNKISEARNKLLNRTLFNVGKSTDYAITAIKKHT